ncbi:hypothetical protein FGM00_07370 [Aggregatimonas sangjinii]|uniref:Uncharacterized protein n=1 Tax=Aggregatimonas sangjinii TaxID=2583587 RepID=A0A5B7SN39_9FLAO|nr:DoxX family protein [Aggregatimonas sangjinii]QCW99926.1 hypothetical protein FGM00_07370 [Aggregatimonas sangjinii]
MTTLSVLTFFSAISFLFFGLGCFVAPQMKKEFERYGLAAFRRIVGVLQLAGALGLIFGYFYSPNLQFAAAVGLCLLMACGFVVRLKIRDTVLQAAPSLIYAVINAFIGVGLVDTL